MAKYVMLFKWTADGIKTVKDSPKRLAAAREAGRALGITIESFYMVMGAYDMVAVVDGPDDAAVARWLLKLASGGAVSSQTLKAFTEDEYKAILAAL